MTGHRHHRRRTPLLKRFHTTTISKTKSSSSQTDNNIELGQTKKAPFQIQNLESVSRITNLPIVEVSWNYAENFYKKIKTSNNLVYWTLGQAEQSFQTVVGTAMPAMFLLEGPISSIDKIVCKSLDLVEQTVPSINLPPEMIYWNTKQYVTNVGSKIVRPVLKRADSVKQIGNTVLASKYTAFAADTLDGALNVADKYVDKYLPADDEQVVDEVNKPSPDGPTGKAMKTIHHVDRFSRKLQRRLTRRTLAEVKALKHHSAEAVHVLIYVAELIATDPKLAFQKGKELWASLSKNEPENQARPENLEQLIVLLTRESARRLVHLINFTSSIVSKVPKKVTNSTVAFLNTIMNMTDSMVKTVHMEDVQKTVVEVVKNRVHHLTIVLKHLNTYISDFLEQLAENLQTQEPPKSALLVPKVNVHLRAENRNPKLHLNGLENK